MKISPLIISLMVLTVACSPNIDTKVVDLNETLNACTQNNQDLTTTIQELENRISEMNKTIVEMEELLNRRCTLYEANDELFQCWEELDDFKEQYAEDIRAYDQLYTLKVEELEACLSS